MSNIIPSIIPTIMAEGERGEDKADARLPAVSPRIQNQNGLPARKFSIQHFPQHQFPSSTTGGIHAPEEDSEPGAPVADPEPCPEDAVSTDLPDCEAAPATALQDDPLDRNPELRSYRGRTVGLLRRYLRYSLETGRLPSVLGSEYFRSGVTSYSAVTFEDRVVFTYDMEVCLERLDEFSRQLIARVVLQEHNRWDAARLLHCNEKTVRRMIPVALDLLSEILLEVGVMERKISIRENSCQGGKSGPFSASDCEDGKYKF